MAEMQGQSVSSCPEADPLSTWDDNRSDRQVARDHDYTSLHQLMTKCGYESTTTEAFLQVKELIKAFRQIDAAIARLAVQDGGQEGKAARPPATEKEASPDRASYTATPEKSTGRASSVSTPATADSIGAGEIEDAHEQTQAGTREDADKAREQAQANPGEEAKGGNIDSLIYGKKRVGYLAMNCGAFWEDTDYEEEEEDDEQLYFEGGSYDVRSNYYWVEEDF